MTNSTQNVHIKLLINGHSIEAAVPVPIAAAPRRVLLPILQKLTDAVVTLAEQSAAQDGQHLSCSKGCDACCRQMVPISPTEAHALAGLFEQMPAEKSQRVLARFDAALEVLEQAGVLDRLLTRHTLSPQELKQLDRDYFATQLPCPLLEDQVCSIHPDRPLACREFIVSSAPKHCADPASGKVMQIPLGAKPSLALAKSDCDGWLPLILARHYTSSHKERTPKSSPATQLKKILNGL